MSPGARCQQEENPGAGHQVGCLRHALLLAIHKPRCAPMLTQVDTQVDQAVQQEVPGGGCDVGVTCPTAYYECCQLGHKNLGAHPSGPRCRPS